MRLRAWIAQLGTGAAAALGAVALELVMISACFHARIASVWELQHGVLWLALILGPLAAAIGAIGAVLVGLCERSSAPSVRVLLTLWAAGGGLIAGWSVGGGRHLSAAGPRALFAALVGAITAGCVYALAPQLGRLISARPARAAWIGAVCVAALEAANRFVLVRLYPPFHLGLALSVLIVAPIALRGALRWADGQQALVDWMRAWAAPALSAIAALSVVALAALPLTAAPAARRLSHFDNLRLLFLDEAPLLGQGVRIAAALAPPEPLEERDCDATPGAPGCGPAAPSSSGPSLSWRGRSILLVSIDALRADHVGAYGYARGTTPSIDAIAKSGALFEHAYAPTAHTSYSVTSLMTGKYMRPLLLQGAGHDSDTWAGLLRTYGYRTSAFYPPAVFFIDPQRFESFERRGLDFEYRKVEFAEGDQRVAQVSAYLDTARASATPLFSWVHLFAPHEPYEAHPEHPYGDRDVDRYDSEIAYADAAVGRIVERFRRDRPDGVVIVTADHGEEFGDHGGRYHGTTVYEEQVHVPLVISAPGAVAAGKRVPEPVQTIDLLPTTLSALDIPVPPRVRGRDLGGLLAETREAAETQVAAPGRGRAFAETDEQTLLCEGSLRLICARKVGACALYDVATDPKETHDLAGEHSEDFERMRGELRSLTASHGRYEVRGLRAEGKGFPDAILRGAAGDGDAAEEVAALLDDADPMIRRKAASVLFELKRPETAPALRLTLTRDGDVEVKRWCALALTRLGQGAPLVYDLLREGDTRDKRLAALALAESGDKRGAAILIDWWKDGSARDFERSRQLLSALASVGNEDAVFPLVSSLDDVRLRPYIAATLARIGDDYAKSALIAAFARERYQSTRVALAEALVTMKVGPEFAAPLVHWLGVPDPIKDGLGFASRAGILKYVGGPESGDRDRLRRQSDLGVAIEVVVPPGGNGTGVRAIVRARSKDGSAGHVILSAGSKLFRVKRSGELERRRDVPALDPARSVRFDISAQQFQDAWTTVPATLGARPGTSGYFVVYADPNIEVDSVALVPLADELPPPPPEPWAAHDGHDTPNDEAPQR